MTSTDHVTQESLSQPRIRQQVFFFCSVLGPLDHASLAAMLIALLPFAHLRSGFLLTIISLGVLASLTQFLRQEVAAVLMAALCTVLALTWMITAISRIVLHDARRWRKSVLPLAGGISLVTGIILTMFAARVPLLRAAFALAWHQPFREVAVDVHGAGRSLYLGLAAAASMPALIVHSAYITALLSALVTVLCILPAVMLARVLYPADPVEAIPRYVRIQILRVAAIVLASVVALLLLMVGVWRVLMDRPLALVGRLPCVSRWLVSRGALTKWAAGTSAGTSQSQALGPSTVRRLPAHVRRCRGGWSLSVRSILVGYVASSRLLLRSLVGNSQTQLTSAWGGSRTRILQTKISSLINILSVLPSPTIDVAFLRYYNPVVVGLVCILHWFSLRL